MGFWRNTLGLAKRESITTLDSGLFGTTIPNWWAENGLSTGSFLPGNAVLADRVWVANRCIQLNAQQVASMPIEFHGGAEPAWVSSPDPNWYPNGISDALFAMVQSLYGWGFVALYVTDFYADGFPRTWTILDSASLSIRAVNGAREYKYGEEVLDPRRVIQIDRNPGTALYGTSALRAYAQVAWGLLAAGNQSMAVSQGATPKFYLKSLRKIDKDQATDVRNQWGEASQSRNGLPPVVPPELEPKEMSFNPSDLALLETQEFNAKAIMSAFGVPAVMFNMGIEGSHMYQSPIALGEAWWRFELRPTATRIANALSAQMLPRGQWVAFDAADTFAPLTEQSDDDDPQLSQVAKASPAQQPRPLTAITGGST